MEKEVTAIIILATLILLLLTSCKNAQDNSLRDLKEFGINESTLDNVTNKEAITIAEAAIKSHELYTDHNARGFEYVGIKKLKCEYCWEVSFKFELDDPLNGSDIKIISISTNVYGNTTIGINSKIDNKPCLVNEQCEYEHAPKDVIIVCQGRVCKQKKSRNIVNDNCIAKGGKVEVKKKDNQTITMCVFLDDSECEINAFYSGECKKAGYFPT